MVSVQLRTRDKLAIGGTLATLSLAAWMIMLYQSSKMGMSQAAQPMTGMGPNLSSLSLVLYLSTWTVMMTAMMLPSAGPMIMTYAAVSGGRRPGLPAQVHTWLFVLGYLLVWGGLGVAAYAISMLLPLLAMPQGGKYPGLIAGAVLVLAGAYQSSPLKDLCLSACRAPLGYLLTHWRDGAGGALLMGLHHGVYCVGCCWALMGVLFLAGTMNVAWMAILALVIFVEKVSSRGLLLSKALGIALIIAGLVVALHGIG